MPDRTWMLYGATGYTGRLVVAEAVGRGLAPILAGRDAAAVAELAERHGLEHRALTLEDPESLTAGLAGVSAVLHCAGPFVHTSAPMVAACLGAGVHYLDITGEIAVFERVMRCAKPAEEAGVVLLPGVGFDVVPTDCTAARLAAALPDAVALELAFHSDRATASRGTLKTAIEALPQAGAIRRGGEIVPVPLGWHAQEIEFSCGPRWAMTIPWGDVSTAHHTTGIPDVRVYRGASPRAIRKARRMAPWVRLLGLRPVKRFLLGRIDRRPAGPSAELRESGRVHVWGRVTGAAGDTVSTTLDTPEAYAFTAVSAVECAERVVAGQVRPGAWTPARAFGYDFVESLPGVSKGPLLRAERTGSASP